MAGFYTDFVKKFVDIYLYYGLLFMAFFQIIAIAAIFLLPSVAEEKVGVLLHSTVFVRFGLSLSLQMV